MGSGRERSSGCVNNSRGTPLSFERLSEVFCLFGIYGTKFQAVII